MNEHGDITNRRNGVDDQLMTLEEVGAYLQVPVKTLYDCRHKGCGPRYAGRSVRALPKGRGRPVARNLSGPGTPRRCRCPPGILSGAA
jgi:hypothetical protein